MSLAPDAHRSLSPFSLVVAASILALALSAPPVHAQPGGFGLSTQYTLVIEYSTTSGYTPTNTNATWTNTNTCGSFSAQGAGATWIYSPTVGNTPCTSSLPSGTITVTISQGATVLASCTDSDGAATYGSMTLSSSSAPGCTTAGTGVTINSFFAQAFDATGHPIAAGSSGNDDWVIAVVVIVILIVLLLFYMRRKRRAGPVAPGAQGIAGEAEAEAKKLAAGAEKEAKVAVDKVKSALNRRTTPAAAPDVPPAPSAGFCGNCGAPLDPGAAFCRKCGKPV